jgi:hypothetical protein
VLRVSSDRLEISHAPDLVVALRDGTVGATITRADTEKFTANSLAELMQRSQFHDVVAGREVDDAAD